MSKFSPSQYLQGLGWTGPGSGLNSSPHARAKPVLIAQKKTLAGVGKDRDTAFPWWEMVFATVAQKAAVGGTEDKHHRTSTGIISHLPPPKPSAYATEQKSGLNLDALADAKKESARRQLYSSFLRGEALSGSAEEDDWVIVEKDDESDAVVVEYEGSEDGGSEKSRKRRKKEVSKEERKAARAARRLQKSGAQTASEVQEEEEDDGVLVSLESIAIASLPTPADSDSGSLPPLSTSTSSKRKRKRATEPTHFSPEEQLALDNAAQLEALAAEEEAYQEAKAIARRAEKDEKRLRKVVRRALKEAKEAS